MCVPQINVEIIPITQYIVNEINGVGVPTRLKGYGYIICGIELVIEDPSHIKNMMKSLYVSVAKANHTDVLNVERSIRYAIEQTFAYGDMTRINEVFKNIVDVNKGKVTSKTFIKRMAQVVISKYLR